MSKQIRYILNKRKKGFHLITDEILALLHQTQHTGIVHIFIQHTSAGLCISENADPTVRIDLDASFDDLAPEDMSLYEHTAEGPDDMPAHIKSILVGSSVTIPITSGKLALGTWQGIYLAEFREHAESRKIVITLL